jgi:type III restriction enzyme
VKDTHDGYFSIDKQRRMVDPKAKGKEKLSDDESAYDLIMKDKERCSALMSQLDLYSPTLP